MVTRAINGDCHGNKNSELGTGGNNDNGDGGRIAENNSHG